MKKTIPAIAAAALLGLAACSQNSQDATANAADAVAADVNATTSNAVDDVSAASDRALGSAEASFDNAGARIDAGADRAGNAISNGADRAADETGAALQSAGNAIRD